ncbi:MAG: methionine--tRNA ligase subunit beta [Candidatus Omnitrophota bacterium]|nr:methionine--tRNA ligase subunit beta [Candidatus Omnitrophota bacterium]
MGSCSGEGMISFDEFKKMDLRVAKVLDVRDHPDADKLYVIQIDVGGQTRQIVAGIRTQYPIEELLGRKIVMINNLEPVTIRGEESRGMLLAANDDGSPVILVPERDVPSGTQIC